MSSDSSMGNDTTQSAQSLPQELKQKLTSQGYTDVKVVPRSFVVTAKDKDGDPVTMIIGPHSLTMFSMMSPSQSQATGNTSSSTTGSMQSNSESNAMGTSTSK